MNTSRKRISNEFSVSSLWFFVCFIQHVVEGKDESVSQVSQKESEIGAEDELHAEQVTASVCFFSLWLH